MPNPPTVAARRGPPTPDDLITLMRAARGLQPVGKLITGARVLDVHRGLWREANVGLVGDRIATVGDELPQAEETIDLAGKWLVPGFFEPHFHAGGTHLSPTRLAEELLLRGTTSTVCDFQEHYTTAGVAAARYALDEALAAGLRVFYLVPLMQYVVNHLGATGHDMTGEDMLEMIDWPETVGINEPPPASLFAEDPVTLSIVSKALARGLLYSGHAPEFTGLPLQAYAATGASSDHESRDAAAAWEKLGLGLKTMMRDGSAAPDLPALVRLAVEYPLATRHMTFATDEVDPVDFMDKGHTDHKVRYAIAAGVDPVIAFQMATLNAAEYYRVDHEIGSITPGRYADILVLDDVDEVRIDHVIASGARVLPAERKAPAIDEYPESIRSVVRLPRPLEPVDLDVAAPVSAGPVEVRVIDVHDGSLVSTAGRATLDAVHGKVFTDPAADVLKIAFIDRFGGTADRTVAFVRGFGLRDGAIATTYQNPFFSLLTLGTSEEAMCLAVNRLAELGGGIVAVQGDSVLAEWQLPIVGVFSAEPLAAVRAGFDRMNGALRTLGCSFKAPVLACTFSGLITIPAYGLSERGLYDVDAGVFVDPVIGAA
jgi:adenine deaminase